MTKDFRDELADLIAEQRDQYDRTPEDMDSEELADAILTSPLLERVRMEGFDRAVAAFESRFFGGPTKDMVRAWFDEARLDAGNE